MRRYSIFIHCDEGYPSWSKDENGLGEFALYSDVEKLERENDLLKRKVEIYERTLGCIADEHDPYGEFMDSDRVIELAWAALKAAQELDK